MKLVTNQFSNGHRLANSAVFSFTSNTLKESNIGHLGTQILGKSSSSDSSNDGATKDENESKTKSASDSED